MAKFYSQDFPIAWAQTTASLASSGSIGSGNFFSHGYARLLGIAVCSGSGTDSASALRVRQSIDGGTNYDWVVTCALSACSGSAFSIEIVGDVIDITYFGDLTADSDEFRTKWVMRPV